MYEGNSTGIYMKGTETGTADQCTTYIFHFLFDLPKGFFAMHVYKT